MSPTTGQIPTRYSPVRHSPPGVATRAAVRLACVRHAASVQSEPVSNSPLKLKIFKSFDKAQTITHRNRFVMLGYFIRFGIPRVKTKGPDASTHTSYQVHTVKEQKTAMDAAFMRRGSISPKVTCGNSRGFQYRVCVTSIRAFYQGFAAGPKTHSR